jgi:hypothetical protein
MVENFGSRPSIVSKISLAALFQGRQPVHLPLRTVAGTGLLAPVVQSIGLSSLIVGRSVRQKASGNVIPTRKYREVLVTFSLAGSGDRGAAALRGAFNDPSTCCTDGSLRKYLCFHSEAQQARLTPRVITALPSARPPQGERTD